MFLNISKEDRKTLIIFLLIPLVVGFISAILSSSSMSSYMELNKPGFAPPAFIFPIVWTILYILMGISSYKIYETMSHYKGSCLLLYGINLILNFVWPLIFFNLEARLFAFIFILFLDIVVILMIFCFLGINKKAAYLQIPYLLWLLFATILNFSVYFLNR